MRFSSFSLAQKNLRITARLRSMRGDIVLTFANWLLRRPGHRFRLLVLHSLMRIDVDRTCSVERGVRLLTRGGVSIGPGSNIARNVTLDGRGGLRIGAGVNISWEVALLTAEHDLDSPDFSGRLRPTVIGDRCWLATRCIILPGSTVGEGSVIGAGSVVRGEVEPWSVAVGAPAKPIRARSRDAQVSTPPLRRWAH